MKSDRMTAILYPTSLCNLNCKYCNIDKNIYLNNIDKELAESFEDENYYFNQIKKFFPNIEQLKILETWGGEPFLHMERIYNTLHKIIQHYPYFEGMFSSTNFSYDNWEDKVFDLLEQFNKYPYRNFTFQLQLSCDGPQEINDTGRGENVTKKCLQNYNNFIEKLSYKVPANVKLIIAIKPTLSIETLNILTTKESIINYYKFFEEEFIDKFFKYNSDYSNLSIAYPIPNIAQPCPATKEDGINFMNFIKNTREIEAENKEKKYFQYYSKITPFDKDKSCINCKSYNLYGGLCGIGHSHVGFLPKNLFTTCHEGFINYINQYKYIAHENNKNKNQNYIEYDKYTKEQKNRLCLTEEQYLHFEQQIDNFYKLNTSALLSNTALEIVTLAMANQIEKKYLDFKEATKAAYFLTTGVGYCLKDNINITGSLILIPLGNIRLLLNGAIDYILKDAGE